VENENATIVQIGKRNLKAPNDWELLDLNKLTFQKPTVLCLSGSGAFTNQQANGLVKQVATYLDLLFKTKASHHTLDYVDIVGIKYAKANCNKAYLSISACHQLANAMLSLLVDQNGNKLTLDQAMKNMSRLTFFTYCDGAFNLHHKIIECLNQKLTMVGYLNQEIIAINNATLNVSFAPNTIFSNKIPSVNVISLNDPVMKQHLENLLTKEEGDGLDGIYLYQDKPGSLYGRACDMATSGSIQIISSGLLNSYAGDLNEHYISLIARDDDWNLKPRSINNKNYHSHNADCVSQMIAWSLCKGVENSVQNFKSEKYIPNTYWYEMMDDLKSIINSYDREQLIKNPTLMRENRKTKFNLLRGKKQFELAHCLKNYHPAMEVVAHDLKQAKTFNEVMFICEKYDYHHADKLLPKINFLTADERLALTVAMENKGLQIKTEVGQKKSQLDQIYETLKASDKSFKSILKICDDYDYLIVPTALAKEPDLLTAGQMEMISKIGEIKTNALKEKMKLVAVPSYETMVTKLNHANSLAEVIAYLKKQEFLGIEYVLPEVQVLTASEKNYILNLAGIKQKQTLEEKGLER